jgi:hypothetical protein
MFGSSRNCCEGFIIIITRGKRKSFIDIMSYVRFSAMRQ